MPLFHVGDEALLGDTEVTIAAPAERKPSGEHYYAVTLPDGQNRYVSEYKLRRWHYIPRDTGRKLAKNPPRKPPKERRIRSQLT